MSMAGLLVIPKNWKYPVHQQENEKAMEEPSIEYFTGTWIDTDKSINNTEMKRQAAV